MVRNSQIAIFSILVLAIAACASEEQSSNPTPSNTPSSVIKKPVIQTFKNPVVPAKNTSAPKPSTLNQASANLIPSTNAEQRVGVVLKGRNDPFGQISGSYPVQVLPNNVVAVKPVPILPPLRHTSAKQTSSIPRVAHTTTSDVSSTRHVVASSINKNLLRQQKNKIALTLKKAHPTHVFTPVLPSVLPQVIPNHSLASVLPPPPQPELARAVLVKGIVLVGKEPEAIIKVPTEPSSRYVQSGQRLANGVLIKRIEMNEGSNPVVILEQYGIEVARMVGEGASSPTPPTASTPNAVSGTSPPPNPVPTGAT